MNLKEPLMFPCRQKINFILHVFFDILQRYCKSQSDTKACEYMSISAGKKSPSSTTFSVNIAKICKLCIWGTLGMSGYAHPKRKYQFVENLGVFLHAKITLHHSLFLNPAIWLVNSILAHRTRTLQDMGLVVYQ